MRKAIAVLLTALFSATGLITTPQAAGAPPSSFDRAADQAQGYLAELLARAEQHTLADHPVWRALLHYKPSAGKRVESQVDGPNFFLSARGKHQPAAELRATLAAFFSTEAVPPGRHSAQCQFPARFHWLKQQLDFDAQQLPHQSCPRFEFFARTLRPVGMTIIFPSAHPSSPASMFGHTLIRLDRAGQTPATRLLDYTINFAAETGSTTAASYAVRGLFGGFPGHYRVIPYHLKLREYAQLENRDIWEYRLNLPAPALDFIVRHTYELQTTYYDYYFFTENCAYHLLSLIEPSLPEQRFTDAFGAWVLPVDILRLLDQRGLISRVDYYPSRYRIIQTRRATMTESEQKLALAISNNRLRPDELAGRGLAKPRQAAILDLAYDFLRYTEVRHSNMIDSKLSPAARALLTARSRLGIRQPAPTVAPPSVRPDQGHLPGRAGIGRGALGGQPYWLLDWRAVYHDWLDPLAGYSPNFALEFGRLQMRYFPRARQQTLQLERLHLVRIDNMEPRDRFFHPLSWRITVGLEDMDPGETARLAFVTRGGAGFSYRPFKPAKPLVYALLEAEILASRQFGNYAEFNLGPSLGLLASPSPNWRIALTGHYREPLPGSRMPRRALALRQSWASNRHLAIRLNLERQHSPSGWHNGASLSLHRYW